MNTTAQLATAIGVILAAGGAGVWLTRTPRSSSSSGEPLPRAPAPASWIPPAAAAPYRGTIDAAEGQNGIPPLLLARLLYQESRFRADVIDGRVRSSAGALGVAQIVPRFHPGVDPLEPHAAIWYAAQYLADNKRRFGSWAKALAAYNFGPTALSRVAASPNWLKFTPTETQRYVREILADVPVEVVR